MFWLWSAWLHHPKSCEVKPAAKASTHEFAAAAGPATTGEPARPQACKRAIFGLSYPYLEKLKELKTRANEITPADNKWIINSLAVAPGELIMPEGATNRALDQMAKRGLRWTIPPVGKMQPNGGGIHCSATPLIRDQD